MPIHARCPCGQEVWAEDQYAGKRVKCPGCQQPFFVPNPNEALEVELEEDIPRAAKPEEVLPPHRAETGASIMASGLLDAFVLESRLPINCLEFGLDCSYALAAAGPVLNKLDLRTAKHYLPMRAHEAKITAVAVSPDNRLAASADQAGNILLWDINENRGFRWLSGHHGMVSGLAFAPSGAFLASAGAEDATVRFWEVPAGKELVRLREEQGVTSVAYSRDGELVLTGSRAGYVSLWDVRRAKMLQDLKSKPLGRILKVAFSYNGDKAMAAGRDQVGVALCSWDMYRREGKVRYRDGNYLDGFRRFNDVAFSQCGTRCLAAGEPVREINMAEECDEWFAPVFFVGLKTGATARSYAAHVQRSGLLFFDDPRPPTAYCVALSQDGLRGLVGYSNGTATYWGLY